MSHEYGLSPEQQISHVESVVHQHPEVAGLQAYEYFRSAVANQEYDFTSGEITKLSLIYPDLTKDHILSLSQPMLSALETLMPGEKTEKSEALYRAVEYRYSELFMLEMARIMNTAATPAERREAAEWFVKANEALYGKPYRDVFDAIAKSKIAQLTVPVEGESSVIQELRAELSELTGPIDETNYQIFEPTAELVSFINSLVHERFGELVDHIDADKTYEVDEIAEVLETALRKMGGPALGWRVAVVPNSSALAVSAHQRLVEVGEDRQPIEGPNLKGKTLHEIGVHAGRSISAERAGWLSAAYGQDGYLDFEEAFATALEDAYAGEFHSHGEEYFLTAGLAYGLDNHEPRDLKETFEVIWRTEALAKVQDGQISSSDIETAKSKAFRTCLRLFRGTTGRQAGVVYLKDLAYFKGQEAAWSVLEEVRDQADFDFLFAGKLDMTRNDHKSIAVQIIRKLRVA